MCGNGEQQIHYKEATLATLKVHFKRTEMCKETANSDRTLVKTKQNEIMLYEEIKKQLSVGLLRNQVHWDCIQQKND